MKIARWGTHDFIVYTPATTWNDVGGVYIFCGVNPENEWQAYYIGQADSFANRLSSHDRWDEAVRLGATHVHAMVVEQEASRDIVEQALIELFQPELNTHHL